MKTIILTLFIAASFVFSAEAVRASEINVNGNPAVSGAQQVPGEFIVKFKAAVPPEAIERMNREFGTSILSVGMRGGFMKLSVPHGRTVEDMVRAYNGNPHVEYAEPNYLAFALFVPNDPYYPYQWHLDNPVYGGIHMEAAWDLEKGDNSVIVAVLDTGVAYEDYSIYKQAPDLAATSFVPGYDFANGDAHPNDDHGHGTHVTGTIAQSTDNNTGVAGVAFNVSIMPVKVLDSSGSGTYFELAQGIYYAVDHGAKVINMSLGGSASSITLEDAAAYAYQSGVTMVCAAGNNAQQGNFPSYPAAYDPYCIAVGATRYDETRAYYSNTGAYVDIVAPGGDVTVDQNNDGYVDGVLQQTIGNGPADFGYYFFQGTSMATPHVSGVAALLISKGLAGPANIENTLELTAEDLGSPGWDSQYGWGLVDAYAALSSYSPSPVHDAAITTVSAPTWVYPGTSAEVTVTVANQGNVDETVDVTLTDETDSSLIGSQSLVVPTGGTTDLPFTWDVPATASLGMHTLRAEVGMVPGETDASDNIGTAASEVRDPLVCIPSDFKEKGRACRDGLDNDCDTLIDAADPDCQGGGSGGGGASEICDDGIDNDGDGKIDCSDKKDCNKFPACM